MKSIIIVVSCLILSLGLISCGGKNPDNQERRWSKPKGVLEGCDGVMSNSQQCSKNPNNQQYLIEIERK